MRRDTEALAELHRASLRPVWDNYDRQLVGGQRRLDDYWAGAPFGVMRVANLSAYTGQGFAQLRDAGRVATVLAMRREASGDAKGGLRIRLDLMRCCVGPSRS